MTSPSVVVPRPWSPWSPWWLGIAVLTGCSAASHDAAADREVAAILGTADSEVLGNRSDWVVQPAVAPEPPKPEPPKPAAGQPQAAPKKEPAPMLPPVDTEHYDLPRALATAVAANRDYQTRKEALYQQGLSLSLTRFDFGPQLNATVSSVWSGQQQGPGQHQLQALVTASQLLPTGGTLALTGSASGIRQFGGDAGDPAYSSSLGGLLTQPLLRGAGYDVSHEPLIQAERSLIYAVRDFELFREGFAIDVARRFFDLQTQRKTLANEDTNYQSAVFDRGKAEALQRVGRNGEQEVFRARRRAIEAKDQLINATAAYDRALDEFKILLGLPTTAMIDIVEVEPPYEPVRIEVASAVAAARHNRLDLITDKQRVEDAERALAISGDDLLPRLDLVATAGLGGADPVFEAARPRQWNSSVGLVLTVPLQQLPQRNRHRSAGIDLEQARRSLAQHADQLDLLIRDELRQLRSTEEQIELQKEQITQEQAAVTVTQIRYEAGKLENRDLLEARQALVDAQNALIQLKAGHFIGRLTLLKDLGVFFVDERGMWR